MRVVTSPTQIAYSFRNAKYEAAEFCRASKEPCDEREQNQAGRLCHPDL
jgi:hypothetical protein